ncbi:hypothetical protein [Micromonospora sp. NPDC047740]|uniref:hypothetical protein n=1 Tax=Micromonospora sp. NPDC047740 TaxID=3364254 RepID=UPI0037200019
MAKAKIGDQSWFYADDIRFLVEHLGLTTTEEVLNLCVFKEEVPGRARLVLGDVFDGGSIRSRRAAPGRPRPAGDLRPASAGPAATLVGHRT